MLEIEKAHTPSDVYTWGYYDVQNPFNIDYVARLKGLRRPDFNAPFTYCDLGCGNAVSAYTLAACFPQGEFYGVDINPLHINNAQHIKDTSGLKNLELIEAGFENLLKQDLPQFDYIALHGVYTWVGREARKDITQLIKKFLKPNGLVFVSYNSMPGWADLLPMQKFIWDHGARVKGDEAEKVRQSIERIKYLSENGAGYFLQGRTQKVLEKLYTEDVHYLVHEYFVEGWEAIYFSQIVKDMRSIDMAFIGSTFLQENYMELSVPEKLLKFFTDMDDPYRTELYKDYVSNTMLRCDVFCNKEVEKLKGELTAEDWMGDMIVSSRYRKVDEKNIKDITAKLGFSAFIDQIKELSDGTRTVSKIVNSLSVKDRSKEQIYYFIQILIASGILGKLGSKVAQKKATQIKLSQFNETVLKERLFKDKDIALASSIKGGGVMVGPLAGLCLMALFKASDHPVDYAMQFLDKPGVSITHEGEVLTDREEIRKRIIGLIENFDANFGDAFKYYGVY